MGAFSNAGEKGVGNVNLLDKFGSYLYKSSVLG
jgi:hypothetical protein